MRITRELENLKTNAIKDFLTNGKMRPRVEWPEPELSVLQESFVDYLHEVTSTEVLRYVDYESVKDLIDSDIKRIPVTINIDGHAPIVFVLERIRVSPWWTRGSIVSENMPDAAVSSGWYQVIRDDVSEPITTYYLGTALAIAGMELERLLLLSTLSHLEVVEASSLRW